MCTKAQLSPPPSSSYFPRARRQPAAPGEHHSPSQSRGWKQGRPKGQHQSSEPHFLSPGAYLGQGLPFQKVWQELTPKTICMSNYDLQAPGISDRGW